MGGEPGLGGRGWGCAGVPGRCPLPVVQVPHPHSTCGLSAQVRLGPEGSCAFVPTQPQTLHFPQAGPRGPCAWPGGSGAPPVTFPRGPDTLQGPLRLPQTLGQGRGEGPTGAPSSA